MNQFTRSYVHTTWNAKSILFEVVFITLFSKLCKCVDSFYIFYEKDISKIKHIFINSYCLFLYVCLPSDVEISRCL